MQIAHATNSLSRSGGGTPHVVWGMAIEQQNAGHEVRVLGLSNRFDAEDWPSYRNTRLDVRTYHHAKPHGIGWSRDLHSALVSPMVGGHMDVLHQHGIWSMLSHSVSRWRKQWHGPSVVAAHGMLDGLRLKKSYLKKKVFGLFCERKNLQSASCLHALCRPEAQSMRHFGLRQPIAVIPNGIRLDSYATLPNEDRFAERFPQCKGRPIVLYLGRITQLKGISHLLDAWKRLERHRRDGWLLVVAGPNQAGFEDTMKQKATALGLDRDVLFPGTLYGEAKQEVLSAASVFSLPSLTEGFSISLLEAMACKIPLVITQQCNCDEVGTNGAGWVGQPNADSTAELLEVALSQSDAKRRQIGQQGHDLVKRKYTWKQLSHNMLEVYQWLLGSSAMPSCVETV